MVNARERAVVDRYEAAGWRPLRGGSPDFIMVKVDADGNITDDVAVEVKSPTDSLSYEQLVFRKFLERHGVRVVVEVVNDGN